MRARTRITKGPGNKDAGLAMVFKLLQAAEGRWRAVNGPHLVALVRAGARFEKGCLADAGLVHVFVCFGCFEAVARIEST